MWSQFWDMHSGGGTKEAPYEMIYIEAPEQEAKIIFYNRFGHNPERVSCTCCGEDYSITEGEDLLQLSGYHRNCDYQNSRYVETPMKGKTLISIEQYLLQPHVLAIRADDIKDEERTGDVPQEGYIWQ